MFKFPLELSHSRIWPGLSILSAPVTRTISANPEEIYENAETIEFVPELHKLSIE